MKVSGNEVMRKKEVLSGLESLLEMVGLEVTTEGVRTCGTYSLADPEVRGGGGAKEIWGLCPQRRCTGQPPRSWSINAFCVKVKAFL